MKGGAAAAERSFRFGRRFRDVERFIFYLVARWPVGIAAGYLKMIFEELNRKKNSSDGVKESA